MAAIDSAWGKLTLTDKNTPSTALVRVLLAMLCLIWGSTWVVIKGGLQDLPPFTSAGARFALAAVIMIGVAAILGRREGGTSPPAWLWIVQGTTCFAISYGIVYHAETILPSGLVSLLFGIYPMLQAASGPESKCPFHPGQTRILAHFQMSGMLIWHLNCFRYRRPGFSRCRSPFFWRVRP